MKKIIEETETIAKEYLSQFGFPEESIASLIEIAKRDIQKEMQKLTELVNDPNADTESINRALHALKGLFFQVGNHAIAEQINEIRSHIDNALAIQEIKNLFRL